MKEIDINIEGYNVNGICVGCLNYKRKMFYVEEVKDCFKLIADIDVPDGLTIQVCWECFAAARTVMRFRKQIVDAYNILIDYSAKNPFLSSPTDFTRHASTNLSIAEFDTVTIDPEETKNDPEETKDDPEETKDEVEVKSEPEGEDYDVKEEDAVKTKDELPEVDVQFEGFAPEDHASSEDDVQLSKLKEKKERRDRKRRKKTEKILRDDQIEKTLQQLLSSEDEEDDYDDEYDNSVLDYVPKTMDSMLDDMQNISQEDLIDILEGNPINDIHVNKEISDCTVQPTSSTNLPDFYRSDPHVVAKDYVPPSPPALGLFASSEELTATIDEEMPLCGSPASLNPEPLTSAASEEILLSAPLSTDPEMSIPAFFEEALPCMSSEVASTNPQLLSSSATNLPTYAELQARERSWKTKVENFEEVDFSRELEPTKAYNYKSAPIEYFGNLFTDEIFEIIVEYTNKYAALKHSKFWTDTNVNEIKAFLALIILMGISPQSQIALYWSGDPFYNNIEISRTMSCKRFKKILENIHVCDITTNLPKNHPNYDKLQKIRPLLNHLNRTFQENASNSQNQSLDESMIKFKDRDCKKQNMPAKPIKRGFKAWCRCDAQTGYLYQVDIYSGKDDQSNEEGLGYRVVTKLGGHLPRNTHLVFDNFFSSVALMEALYIKGIYATATVRMQRKGLPKDLNPPKPRTLEERQRAKENKLEPGEFTYRFSHPSAVVKWRDTKDVFVITTAVNPTKVEIIKRKQKDGQKKDMFCPSAIAEYTRRMGGVDHIDHFRSSYSIGRRSKKSWFRLFWFLFESAVINSYILYQYKNESRQNIHRDYRLRLARGLKAGYVFLNKREPVIFKNKKGGVYGVPDEIRLGQQGSHFLTLSTFKRCRFCSTKQEEKRSKYMCEICKVTLCVTPCMKIFHQSTEE